MARMPGVSPGDIARTETGDKIVVDLVEDDGERWAILRDPDDMDGEHLDAVDADALTVIGHADSISGWVEGADGEWRRVNDSPRLKPEDFNLKQHPMPRKEAPSV